MKKQNQTISILAAASFVAAMAEGFFYYAPFDQFGPLKLLTILYNAVKAFFLIPIITIPNVISNLQQNASILKLIVAHAYGVAVLLAPLCTAMATINAIRFLLRKKASASANQASRHIFLFGYNENVACLLENHTATTKPTSRLFFWKSPVFDKVIHLVTAEELPESTQMAYLQKGIFVHQENCLMLSNEKLKAVLCQLHISLAQEILLFEDSTAQNFSLFLSIQKCGCPLAPDAAFYLSGENEGVRRIIEEFGNQADQKDAIHNLTLFSIPELKVRHMFQAYPLFTYNISALDRTPEPDWDVHMLIAGFGSVGQEVLKQTIQLGVMNSSGSIIIDVVDTHADERKSMLQSMFNADYRDAQSNPDEIAISGTHADGVLKIRFHKLDVRADGFRKKLTEISADRPITYAAVCTQDADVTLHCMAEIERFIHKNPRQNGKTPVAIRLEFNAQVADYLQEDEGTFCDVFPLGANQSILRTENIFDTQTQNECIAFHALYNQIYDTVQKQQPLCSETLSPISAWDAATLSEARQAWHSLASYKKNSNRCLSYHSSVKRMLLCWAEWHSRKGSGSFSKFYETNKGNVTPAIRRLLSDCADPAGKTVIDSRLLSKRTENTALLEEFLKLEHRRWCYAMALNGWGWTDGPKQESLQLSPYMTHWEGLCAAHPDVCLNDIVPLLVFCCEQPQQAPETQTSCHTKA